MPVWFVCLQRKELAEICIKWMGMKLCIVHSDKFLSQFPLKTDFPEALSLKGNCIFKTDPTTFSNLFLVLSCLFAAMFNFVVAFSLTWCPWTFVVALILVSALVLSAWGPSFPSRSRQLKYKLGLNDKWMMKWLVYDDLSSASLAACNARSLWVT